MVAPRGRAALGPGIRVMEGDVEGRGDPLAFTLIPGAGQPAWHLKATSQADKHVWLRAFHQCTQIASWLQRFRIGRLLGAGSAGTVYELCDAQTGAPMMAVKEIPIADASARAAVIDEARCLV